MFLICDYELLFMSGTETETGRVVIKTGRGDKKRLRSGWGQNKLPEIFSVLQFHIQNLCIHDKSVVINHTKLL